MWWTVARRLRFATKVCRGIFEKAFRNKQSSTRMRAGPGKSRPRRAAPRSGCMQPGPAQIRGLGLLFPHGPATCTLLTDLNVARIIWCTPRNEENRFERFPQRLHFVWLSYGKFLFDVRKVVVVQQGSRRQWCWEFACCRSSSIRRTCFLMSP